MYSPEVVDRTLHRYTKAGLTFKRRSIPESREITEKLTALLTPEGLPSRSWLTDEQDFIDSEIRLCRADFRYFAERYGYCEQDASEGGGVAPMTFWPSQERTMKLIGDRDEQNWRNYNKYGFSDGIWVVWHKTRQQGATAIARMISQHRMCLFKNTRAIAASLDQEKKHELYMRDKVVLDNLPFFLKPRLEFDVKDQHVSFEDLKSRITYQQASQDAGVGTSGQFDISHMTEVALWPYAERLQFDFIPTVPQSPQTFVGWESTAAGRAGFWYEFTENVRRREYGFSQWIYSFTPWYINYAKNRLIPPEDWTPNKVTIAHAQLVERTSHEFAGETIRLGRPQMYWWETQYMLNAQIGTLHIHFSNFPATPEQSFQHSAASALPIETIEWMRANADLQKSMPYAVNYNLN